MKPAEGSTVIGKSITVRGELSGNEDLYLDGDMEGTITLSEHVLTLGPNARVLANVRAKDIIVYGNIEGDMHATGKVEIRGSAVVNGNIFSRRLSIEENASIRVRVNLGASEASGPSAEAAEAPNPEQEVFLLEPKA
jgi:cytoskeletal protein CcmA (bactofilin family)